MATYKAVMGPALEYACCRSNNRFYAHWPMVSPSSNRNPGPLVDWWPPPFNQQVPPSTRAVHKAVTCSCVFMLVQLTKCVVCGSDFQRGHIISLPKLNLIIWLHCLLDTDIIILYSDDEDHSIQLVISTNAVCDPDASGDKSIGINDVDDKGKSVHQTGTACSWLVCHSWWTVQIVSTYPTSPEPRPPSFLGSAYSLRRH